MRKVCKTVKCLQEQVHELRHVIFMMTGQGEKEESRGGENEKRRGGEKEESRDSVNEESRGSVREKAGKKKKDGKRKRVQQKEGKWVSEEGLSGGKMVEDNERR